MSKNNEFIPEPPPYSRSPVVITPHELYLFYRSQGGYGFVSRDIQIVNQAYAPVDEDWVLYTALPMFRRLQESIHGLPFGSIYQPNYKCNHFSIGFAQYLADCQRLYWKEDRYTVLAIGWGYTGENASGNIPPNHSVSLAVTEKEGDLKICGIESQDSGRAASYGITKCMYLFFVHF